MNMSEILSVLSYFIFYAVLGWCVEVVYATTNTGKFINRGFLNGPLCPIYGVGATIVVILLNPISDNLLFLFVGSVFLTSAIELITGFVLEKIFHQKWWDYSMRPFNIGGYICLRFSLAWGFACTFVMKVIQPVVDDTIAALQQPADGKLFVAGIAAFYIIMILDIAVTVIALARIHMRLRLINDIDRILSYMSDTVGEMLSDGTLKGMKEKELIEKRYEKLIENAKKKAGEKYLEHIEKRDIIHRRIENAFPSLDLSRFEQIGLKIDKMRKDFEIFVEEKMNK